MNLHLQLARDGVLKALKTTLLLAKIVIPVTLAVVALEQLGLMIPLARWFSPVVRFLGLPGETALALLLGFFVNNYASFGVIAVLPLSAREVTVLSAIILTSHSLTMEGPVLKYTGLSPLKSTLIRIAAALLFGFVINMIYGWLGG